jgi:hypothetical protein
MQARFQVGVNSSQQTKRRLTICSWCCVRTKIPPFHSLVCSPACRYDMDTDAMKSAEIIKDNGNGTFHVKFLHDGHEDKAVDRGDIEMS